MIEKVLILRSSEIFQNTPETDLVELASILEEIYLDADSLLFSKGDTGNCMYFIYSGSVKVHDGEHILAVLGENEIVGELSVLDTESRSASATTAEESILLNLSRKLFMRLC
ncbi:MAG: cyclic nucleotide-binding domain-containing protein [Segetibacter sp.]